MCITGIQGRCQGFGYVKSLIYKSKIGRPRYGKFYKYNNYECYIKYLYVNSHPYNVCLAQMTEGQWSFKYFSFFIHNFLWALKLQNVTSGAIRNIHTSHIVLIPYGLAYFMSLLTPVMLSYNFKGYQDLCHSWHLSCCPNSCSVSIFYVIKGTNHVLIL